ncbi:hypothetical protein DSO57_1038431 [Entomophthora muscae]|uniref:Uncharacterized protein n=1 Tax=Entomophthora muscae TaxID=34485 RepID=A0ACC2RPP4_9FUNG|nr:hypothetical protein DSO57_1038431 [Entomophthora muscae]
MYSQPQQPPTPVVYLAQPQPQPQSMPMPMPKPSPVVVVSPQLGGCCDGGAHLFEDEYTTCGIIWAVVCFPVGLICCYADRYSRCRKCRTRRD